MDAAPVIDSSEKKEPLYVVDGSGYIYRAFFAVAPLTNSKGLPTNALFGFARMIIKLLKDLQAHYIAVAFDTKEPTFRHQMYAEYKANRDECPADLVQQMPYFRSIIDVLGIPVLEKAGVEADDIIGTLATRFGKDDQRVVVVSGDKDLMQLVNDYVEVWDAMRDLRYDAAQVRQKFGVGPERVVDYLALVGDSSDNVPGIKGVGPKGALSLLEAFGSVENLMKVAQEDPKKIEEIKGLRGAAAVREKIESGLDSLRLSYQLVQLDTKVSPFAESSSEDFRWHGPKLGEAEVLFEELEFSKILASIPLNHRALDVGGDAGGAAGVLGNTTASSSSAANKLSGSKQYQIVTPESFPEFVEKFTQALNSKPSFAFDTETTGLDPWSADLVGISISWIDNEAYYLPILPAIFPGGEKAIAADAVRNALSPVFADAAIEKIGLNLKFDIEILNHFGMDVAGPLFDAMLASYVLSPDGRQNGLKALTLKHLKERMTTFEEMTAGKDSILEVDLATVGQYACHDADASYRLRAILERELGEPVRDQQGKLVPSLRKVFEEIESPLVHVLVAMERIGIAIDAERLTKLGEEFLAEIQSHEKKIIELAGVEFNLNSPKQLSEVLFEKLQLPTQGVRKTSHGYSTDANVLAKFEEKYEIARELLEYRELFKLKSTYVDALVRLQNPQTGRIHTSFNQAIAATGRLSSSEPNLQNIPIRNPRGRKIREAFVAAPGCKLLSADYSQIELRVLAHLANDENLIAAFCHNEDIHSRTAREIFGEMAMATSAEEKSRLRRAAKTINFGVIYGIGASRLARDLEISKKQAQDYIDNYFGRYPRVRTYFDAVSEQLQKRGYSETLFAAAAS